jgi:hypothetical protein
MQWIIADFKENSIRFCVELLAWFFSVSCSIILTCTTPQPPLHILYPLWVSNCAMFAWASWTRKSFGMLSNYLLLTTIDLIGLFRTFF